MDAPCGLRPALLALLLVVSAARAQHQFHRTFRARDSQFRWVNATGAEWGVITTDGFGEPPWMRRESPPAVTWFLQAPPGYAIVVYTTQYHLSDGDLLVSSFKFCQGRGPGTVHCIWNRPPEHAPPSVEAPERANSIPVRHSTQYKATMSGDSWLVLELDVSAGGGTGPAGGCLVSSESRGFNVTYQVEVLKLPAATSVKALAKNDSCYALQCNLNGDCLMTDFG